MTGPEPGEGHEAKGGEQVGRPVDGRQDDGVVSRVRSAQIIDDGCAPPVEVSGLGSDTGPEERRSLRLGEVVGAGRDPGASWTGGGGGDDARDVESDPPLPLLAGQPSPGELRVRPDGPSGELVVAQCPGWAVLGRD